MRKIGKTGIDLKSKCDDSFHWVSIINVGWWPAYSLISIHMILFIGNKEQTI
jgi:hypothetical protein